MPSSSVQFDREKLKEAVWLLADYCPPEELGNIKLHKALYFADMFQFVEHGRPITGVEYLKQKFGPTARYLTVALRELSSEGKLEVFEQEYHGFYKKTYRPLRSFKPVRLSAAEIALLREMADFVRSKSAREISEISHNGAWEAAEMGEIIPYFTALSLLPEEITEADRQWAMEAAQEHAFEAAR